MAEHDATEIELKLALAPASVARFRRHPLLRGVVPVRRTLLSHYYDTPEHALFRRGVALRLRRVGYHWVQTLKAEPAHPGAVTARPEWEVRVTGNRLDPAVLPEAARACLAGIDTDRLAVVFSTEFTRTAWHVEDRGSSLEIALDVGEIRAGAQRAPLSEIECELKAGDRQRLYDLAGALLAQVPLSLEPRSKAERGYQLAGIVAPGPVRARSPRLSGAGAARVAWQALFVSALGQFSANLPGVVAGMDPEFLHQMRIAIRRMRTLLALGRELGMPRPAWENDLRWLMGELSPARDWDVFVGETLPRVQCGLGASAAALEALAEAAGARRQAAHARVVAALGTPRCVALVLAMEQAPEWSGPDPGWHVQAWAAQALARRLKRMRRLGRDFEQLDAPGRHALRIAVKRLRYSAEAFASLHGRRAGRCVGRLARLQDALGAANDVAMAHALLAELKGAGHMYARGLVEGYLAREAQAPATVVARACRRALDLPAFWK